MAVGISFASHRFWGLVGDVFQRGINFVIEDGTEFLDSSSTS